MAQTNYDWYKLREEIEYSTDFNFFLYNQVSATPNNGYLKFNSRLEKKEFKLVRLKGEFDRDKMIEECRKIHEEILQGKHGKGTFTN